MAGVRGRAVSVIAVACILFACACSRRNEQDASEAPPSNAQAETSVRRAEAAKPAADVLTEAAPAADHASSTATPADMRRIPKQTFFAGVEPNSAGMETGHETQAGPFFVDTYEVTVEQYRRCVDAGSCQRPSSSAIGCNYGKQGRDRHPINCIDWYEADRFCRAQDKRLPTSDEWQLAARGADRRIYPWGSEAPRAQVCWADAPGAKKRRTCEVGSFPEGVSPFGVHDQAGNVAEWTATDEPSSGAGRTIVVQGGGYIVDPMEGPEWSSLRLDLPTAYAPSYRAPDLGFRCVRDIADAR